MTSTELSNFNLYQNKNLDKTNIIEFEFDIQNLIINKDTTTNILIKFIEKHNLIKDKITDIYSHYELYDDMYKDYKMNVIILGDNYIFNITNITTNLYFYEVNIKFQNNLTHIKSFINKSTDFSYKIINDNIYFHYRTFTNNTYSYIFNKLKEDYICNLDKIVTKHISSHMNDINMINYTKQNNHIFFNSNIYQIIIKDNKSYINYKSGENISFSDNSCNINYKRDTKNKTITKQVFCDGILRFDSELYIDGYTHKVIKLENNITQNMICEQIPYFLLENDKNLNTVYSYSPPLTYKYCVNLLNLNDEAIQHIYQTDNKGLPFLYSINGKKQIYQNDKYVDITKDLKQLYNDSLENIYKNRFTQNNTITYDDINDNSDKNPEYVFSHNDYNYRFIINCIITCGLTQSKQTENIAIVVESGANTHDISKIILKADGGVEIIRTNNNNQLIVKSATRNKFEGNIGYKFAISNNVPCVVSLEIPDDAEVVFDHYHNKFRCNKCIVRDIQPIQNKNVQEIQNTCGICTVDPPNVMFSPCCHVVCADCVALYTSSNNECHMCKQKIESYVTLKTDIVSQRSQIEKANSAIYCSDFEYKIGETIIIDNFDISTYWKCSSGIHFHNKVDDVYAWLEYIDIPEELKNNNMDVD